MSAPVLRLLDSCQGTLPMIRGLSIDSHGDRRLLRRQAFWMNGAVRIVLVAAGEDRTQQADLKQDGREGIEGGGVAALGALHGDAEPQRGFGDAVIEQDYARDDLKQVTLDAVEDPLDVMDEDHGVLERVQLIGADAGAETESSEDAGQASDVNRHAEIAAQQSAGVRAIGGQVGGVGFLRPPDTSSKRELAGTIIHACTSARSRVQTRRKETGPSRRREASAFAHGAHCVRSLPARRSQMFPQRSQYFSSILRICDVSDLAFIILISPLQEKNLPPAGGEDCGS